jgi:glutathione S-transferase
MANPALTLVIGNKRYSSWSMRPWLALEATGAPFQEILIPLYQPDSKAAILQHSPTGHVPVLQAGGVSIWDSLAICEYLAERFPAARLWPDDPAVRAVARAVSAEMHSGFAALRQHCSMDILGSVDSPQKRDAAASDILRIGQIWETCRANHDGDGDFLFGSFGIADAMFTPVATRWRTYGFRLPPVAERYAEALLARPAYRQWHKAAEAEPWVIKYD